VVEPELAGALLEGVQRGVIAGSCVSPCGLLGSQRGKTPLPIDTGSVAMRLIGDATSLTVSEVIPHTSEGVALRAAR
jgi:hypothetical protein